MNTDFWPAKTQLAILASRVIFKSMSTVLEIKEAIERLSPAERVKLHGLVWPEEPDAASETPPHAQEKLAEAAKGNFRPGTRANIDKILDSLQ